MSLFAASLPPDLVYVPDWISDDIHDSAVRAIDSQPFRSDLNRRTQHYGYFYDYRVSDVDTSNRAPAAPSELMNLAQRLADEGFFHRVPDQIIVNEYESGQGIAGHIDHSSFGPVVATVSLLESWPMTFCSPGKEKIDVLLERCSLALMIGESRSVWTHEIRKRQTDMVGGLKVPRHRRLSVTFRTVNAKD